MTTKSGFWPEPISGNSEFPSPQVTPRVPVWEPGPPKALSLGDVLSLCLRRWVVSLTVAVLVAGTVLLATSRITPLYEARAQLEITSSGKLLDFQSNPEQQRIDFALLNTVRDRIIATPVLDQVVATSDIADGSAYTKGNPITLLRSRIHVSISRDSWIIELALRDEDAQRAKTALDALLVAYYARMSEREITRSSAALAFLREQASEARIRFDQARDAEEDYRISNGITSSDPDNNAHARRIQELERVKIAIEGQLTAHQAIVKQVDGAATQPDDQRLAALLALAAIADHPLVDQARRQWMQREADTRALAGQFGPKHPRMVQMTHEAGVLRAQLETAVTQATAVFTTNLAESQVQLATVNGRLHAAEEALANYRAMLLRMQALSQESLTRGKLFDELRRGLAEQEIASRLESSQVVVNNPPEAATKPANKHPSLFAGAAVLFGMLAGVAAALVADRVDRRVRGEAGLRAIIDLPVLATIPALDGSLPLLTIPQAANRPPAIGEAFRALRVALRLTSQYHDASAAAQGCCLLVTSPGDGEGRSTVASRLAVSLAAAGARVLLIDADLRRPSLHRQFGVAHGGGFSLLLAGEQQTPAKTVFPNLDLLWAGERPPNPADLLHSPALDWYVTEARKRYDWILFDAPPVARFADTLVLGEHADGVVLVVRDRVSERAEITTALRRMQAISNRLIGFVLNASRDEAMEPPQELTQDGPQESAKVNPQPPAGIAP